MKDKPLKLPIVNSSLKSIGRKVEAKEEQSLGLRGRFGRKEEKAHVEAVARLDELRQICGNDDVTYEALYQVMFLDPRKIQVSMKDAAQNAEKLAKEKSLSRARVWFDIAGGLALYEGDTKKVAEYFSEAEKISGLKYPIVKNAEKAVTKAHEYYEKYLKANV